MCKTYYEVADKADLRGLIRDRFVMYMTRRWKSTEQQKCQDGYAFEWAERFKSGYEYQASDIDGRETLQRIDTDLNNR